MYSSGIEEILKKNNIGLGDTIRLKCKKGTFEGVLMPRPENGDSNILIIKRADGYNVGVRTDPKSTIEKVKARPGTPGFPRKQGAKNRDLPRITLLYTGGTIGSKVDYTTGGVYMLKEAGELINYIPELESIANIEVKDVMHIASEDMSYMEWRDIAMEVASAFKRGSRGVIITMGTDTMHYTSAALSFMLNGINGPVVVTGAQRSSDRGSSDAFMNVICSAHLAAKSDIAEVGICMHSSTSDDKCSFIRGTKVRKMHTSRRDAFRPINSRPIAQVGTDGNISYMNTYRKISTENKKHVLLERFEPNVALVKAYPNSDPEIIDYYKGRGYKGIIIEGTGLGHVPAFTRHDEYGWLDKIKSAIDSGMVVGMTSQCLYGRVNTAVYSPLRVLSNAGVIYCEDMLPEVAYVKLGFLLGNYGPKKAKELLNKDLTGEITERTELDMFIE